MPLLPADFSHARACKPFCEKSLTLPAIAVPSQQHREWMKEFQAEEQDSGMESDSMPLIR